MRTHGEDYYFLTEDQFRAHVAAGAFLEYAEVHGSFYGTLRENVLVHLREGVDVLIDIDTKGAATIRGSADEMVKDALADVFIMPTTMEELRRRLAQARHGDARRKSQRRLDNAAKEMARWRDYRYTIISGSVEEDLAKFRAIMQAERYLSRRFARPDLLSRQTSTMKAKSVVLGVTGSIAALQGRRHRQPTHQARVRGACGDDRRGAAFHHAVDPPDVGAATGGHELWSTKKWAGSPATSNSRTAPTCCLIAPATAQIIAELAWGFANHALSAIALATRAPILVAPAMNGKMWLHPATLDNVERLRARGVRFIGPEEGLLACGYEGVGRLWPVDGIIEAAEGLLTDAQPAGPSHRG